MTLQRGTVIGKMQAVDLLKGGHVYVLTVRCHDDACCEDNLVVSKEMYDSVCIEGLGRDSVIEYGTVLRLVTDEPDSGH